MGGEQRKLIGYYRLLKKLRPELFPKPINPPLKALSQKEMQWKSTAEPKS